ncbi:MAG: sulfatase-like hydrolase/transferase [Kiritimatiellales bacterium]|nr:sulfatase-like hydrolase/transferase [Kiritimatiellales bacterium]
MKILLIVLGALMAELVSATTYPIVDTGQIQAYGTEAGQDAHYLANAPSYKDHGDGTVSDLVTGLMWTQDPGEKMTLAEAEKNAAKCKTGGYRDWRLPTIKELYSLIQLNGTDPDPMSTDTSTLKPFIDDAIFTFKYGDPAKGERIIDSQFATSTKYVSTTMGGNETMFGVNFADGRIKGYPIQTRRGKGRYYVLYVRGNSEYGKNSFKDNDDGTITDEASGLTWMKADSGEGMDWPTALDYAEGMEFAGYSDWRLPNAKELQSIIDYTRSPDTTGSAAIDPIFDATEIINEGGEKDFAHYWTGSTHVGVRKSDTAVYFAFGRSLGWMSDRQSGEKQLMDVHGAGSQRSDPKVGDASRFPYGRGPQGDVIRIDNMVRLVRGGDAIAADAEVKPDSQSEQSPPGERPNQASGRQNRNGPSPDRIFSRFDANNDGRITKDEFKGPERRFLMLDQDNDGAITREEAADAPPPPNRGERPPQQEGAPRPFEVPAEDPTHATLPPVSTSPTDKPNIVFIYADDMGWTGTSLEMIPGETSTRSDFYQTPNLEKLAARGMVFSQAYSPASLCTPSRAAVLTGKTPAELRITTPGGGRPDDSKKLLTLKPETRLPETLPTLGTLLQGEGYTTALLGKWHLGRNDHAGMYGFDFHDGSTQNKCNGTETDPKEIFSLTERGIRFMEESVNAGKPFYLQLSHYAVHAPVQSRPESIGKFEKASPGGIHTAADYAGMTWDLDSSLHQVFQALERLGITDNTYVVFMSDNGAQGNRRKPNNTPLFAGKGTLFEGGIRVPLMIAGPGIKTGYCSTAVCGTDLFATFATWSGASAESENSVDLTPLLTGQAKQFERKQELLFHYPHYGQGPQTPQTALISDEWKLLKDWDAGTSKLFNLDTDIGETKDRSREEPERYAAMVQQMDQRLKETNAQLPTSNPNYDPTATQTTRRRRSLNSN